MIQNYDQSICHFSQNGRNRYQTYFQLPQITDLMSLQLLMNGSSLRQSLYFKKEFVDRSSELVLLFGVDQYMSMQNQELEQELEVNDDWKCPSSMSMKAKAWIEEDYQFALGVKVEQIQNAIQNTISFHWDLRKQEALVDLYKTILKDTQSRVTIQAIFSPTHQIISQNNIVCWIGQLNTVLEEQGIWIRSLIFCNVGLILVLAFDGNEFRLIMQDAPVSKETFLFQVKSSILSRMVNIRQISKQMNLKVDPDIKSKYQQISIYHQICLIYELKKQLGLTIIFESGSNIISDRLVVKSNQCSYRSSIVNIVKKCALTIDNFLFHQELLNFLGSSEEQQEKQFDKLYQKSKSTLELFDS